MADKNKKALYEVETQIQYLSIEQLKAVLADHIKDIKNFAYIIHDKDTEPDGTAKIPHIHCMLKLDGSRRRSDIASWFKLPERQIQDSKTGRYTDMLSYLIHENAPEKHQYQESEVTANFNYAETMKNIRAANGKKAAAKKEDARLSEIMGQVSEGIIRDYNINDYMTVKEYDRYRNHIKSAFEYRAVMLEQKNTRCMDVIYIYGEGGTGKSTYAETIAQRKGYSFKRSASERDPLATYKGQDAFALDDVRGNTFKFQDWMGILDNFQDRPGSSRFHDKHFTECKLLFITTTGSPEAFWKELSAGRPKEDAHQFYRRVKTVIHMTEDEILCRRYDEATKKFGPEFPLENDLGNRFAIGPEDTAEQKEKIADLLGIESSSFLSRKAETEKPIGVMGVIGETDTTPKIRLLYDKEVNRIYLMGENVGEDIQARIKGLADELVNAIDNKDNK